MGQFEEIIDQLAHEDDLIQGRVVLPDDFRGFMPIGSFSYNLAFAFQIAAHNFTDGVFIVNDENVRFCSQ